MSNQSFSKTLTAFALCLAFCLMATGQSGTSRISGSVTDANGAVLEGAKVTVTNEATGVSVTQVTTAGGLFSFASIPPGNYTITVEQTGFKKSVRTGTKVEVDSPLAVTIPLEIGDVAEIVTVQAEAVGIQTNTATIGNVVDQRTIETLPLNGRNPLSLVLQEPGVVQRSFGGAGSGTHINGSRDRAFNVTIDGIDANESSVPNPISNLYRLNPDNVQEFKVTTNNATAEEGRNSGASIGLSTKSGTNQFHGTLFYFNRNDTFIAKEWFANAQNLPKANTKLHQYGIEIGGPVILPFGEGRGYDGKNKTFFFGSWQQNRVDFTQPIDQLITSPLVYTSSLLSGTFRYWIQDTANPLVISGTTITRNNPLLVNPQTGALRTDLGVVPCSATITKRCVQTYSLLTGAPVGTTFDPYVTSFLSTLPLPNNFSVGDGLNWGTYSWNPPTAIRGPAYSLRIDHNFNGNNSVFGRFLFSDYNTLKGDPLNGRPQVYPNEPPQGEVFRRTSNFVAGWRRNISPYITNDFRWGYSKFNFLFTQGEANPAFPDVPSVDFNTITEPYLNTARTQREIFTPQFIDNLNVVKGAHNLGFGLNFRFYRHQDNRSLGGPTVSMSATTRPPTGFAAAPGINLSDDNANLLSTINNLFGFPAQISQIFVADFENDVFLPYLSDGDTPTNLFSGVTKADQYNFYAQDEWRVSNNFTLNYGARWEINPAASTEGGTFVPNGDVFAGPVTFVEADSWYKINNWKYIGPSLGIAYSPDSNNSLIKAVFGGQGKSVIRAGYRVAFDPISTFQVTSAASRIPGLIVNCSSTVGGQTTPGCETAPNLRLGQGFPQFLSAPNLKPSAFLTPPVLTRTNAPGITLFAPEMELPTVHQWSLSVQRELPWQMVMQAAYVGRRGTHLFFAGNRNQVNIDPILSDFLKMQQNDLKGCLPSGASAGTCNTGVPIGIVTAGYATAAFVNSSTTIGELKLNNIGNFANRLDNTTAALPLHLRPNQQFNVITYLDNAGDSKYHALQLTLRRRFAQGLGLAAAYTFGKSTDNQSVDPIGASSGGGLSTTNSRTPTDMRNLAQEWARSDFDRTHVFNLTAVWEIPFGKGRAFGSNMPGWLDQIVGGWTLNGISTYMSGEPFSVRSGVFTSNGGHESRADVIDPTIQTHLVFLPNIFGPSVFENSNAFAIPAVGSNGAGRNIFLGPSYYNLDLGLIKTFSLSERFKLDFRTEIFNALNHANFDNPRDASVGSPNFRSTLFGQTCCVTVAPPSTQTIIQNGESARVFQFALKLKF
jgi:hypothetical protein